MAQLTTLGIDTPKQVFHLHGDDQQGNIGLHKYISRKQGLPLLAQEPPCLPTHTPLWSGSEKPLYVALGVVARATG